MQYHLLPSFLQKMQLMATVSYSGIHHDRCKVRHALEPPFCKFSALPGAADYRRQEIGSIVCFHLRFISVLSMRHSTPGKFGHRLRREKVRVLNKASSLHHVALCSWDTYVWVACVYLRMDTMQKVSCVNMMRLDYVLSKCINRSTLHLVTEFGRPLKEKETHQPDICGVTTLILKLDCDFGIKTSNYNLWLWTF